MSADKPVAADEPEPGLPDSRDHAVLSQDGQSERHIIGSGVYPLAKMGFIEYDRVLFFSDAVFAIAITILAVNLHVPLGGPSFGTEIRQAAPSLVGFGISFAAIGLFWVGHHGMFRHIIAFDRPMILLNLLFLGTIAFLPYPTELLNRRTDTGSAAVIFYSVCISAAGLVELACWLYATRKDGGLSGPSAPDVRLSYALRIARVPIVFLASIPVALAAPRFAPFCWLAIVVLDVAINRFAPARFRA